ncbi:glutamate and aspartate transporter subunit [Shigella boydii]|uniref:Glutamate and aspartate transporter subunit n=1 Tax=Shigella boydii TaxID=621 RepID=A0A2X2K1Q8_SHIBO|nr:glutamate and aspartate transporter subunit [Shigella boydii]
MQLRKPATAILALALSAGLAQADDAAPAAGSTQYAVRWTKSPKTV